MDIMWTRYEIVKPMTALERWPIRFVSQEPAFWHTLGKSAACRKSRLYITEEH